MTTKTKKELIEQGVTNQGRLVDLLTVKSIKPVKKVIPGGATLWNQIDKKSLPSTIYTWLRTPKNFQEFKICFAKSLEGMKLETEKVLDYSPKDGGEWGGGKRKAVADDIAKVLGERAVVSLQLKQDGIYIVTDPTKQFSPTRLATEADVVEGRVRVGDKVPSDNWEPYLEWVPRSR